MRFIIQPGDEQLINEAVKAMVTAEMATEITIKPYKPDKSAAQRNWFHKLCEEFGEQVGLRKGQVKEIAKAQLFGWEKVTWAGIEITMAGGSSEDLKMDEYSQLIEILYQMAAEAEIVLPDARR